MNVEQKQFLFSVNHARITAFSTRRQHCRLCRLSRRCVAHQLNEVTLFALPAEYWRVPAFPRELWHMVVLDGMDSVTTYLYLSSILAAPAPCAPRPGDNTRRASYWAMVLVITRYRRSLEKALTLGQALPTAHTAQAAQAIFKNVDRFTSAAACYSRSAIVADTRKLSGSMMETSFDLERFPKRVVIEEGGYPAFDLVMRDGYVQVVF
jgi:hypothetical protein